MEEKIYLALLHSIGLSHKKLHEIFANIQNYKEIYNGLTETYLLKYGFNQKQINNILKRYKNISYKSIEKSILERKVKIFTVFDSEYPRNLLHISHVPFVIYVRGTIDDSQKFSIIGTRKISSYGKKVIQNIVPDISRYFVIVSGGAAGCDTEAHKVTLGAKNKTLSVIGTGIDQDYPVGNKGLYDNIVNTGGGILSIFPVGEVGNSYNFPIRNEIVAGLSVGTLVIEGQIKSGTMITSGQCLDLGKDLFCIPGDIYNINSQGCNELIKNGSAKLVGNSIDILNEYNIGKKGHGQESLNKNIEFSDDLEKTIYNLLLIEKQSVNDLSKKVNIDVRTLGFKLSMLELNGSIKRGLSGYYEIS